MHGQCQGEDASLLMTTSEGSERHPRVLIVEDDEGYAALVGSLLDSVTSVRFSHDRAASLSSAVEQLSRGPYQIVLLDLGLPDAQHLEALTALINMVPDVPVIVLSGAEDEELALQAVKTGAQDYLLKGQATAEIIGRSIRYAIERKQSELQMKRLAFRDMLTELPNRVLLMEYLNAALKRAERGGHV